MPHLADANVQSQLLDADFPHRVLFQRLHHLAGAERAVGFTAAFPRSNPFYIPPPVFSNTNYVCICTTNTRRTTQTQRSSSGGRSSTAYCSPTTNGIRVGLFKNRVQAAVHAATKTVIMII